MSKYLRFQHFEGKAHCFTREGLTAACLHTVGLKDNLVAACCGKCPVLMRMTPNTHWEYILGSNPISRVVILGRTAKGIRRIEEHIPWSVDGHQVQVHRFILKGTRRNLISSNT